MAAFMQATMAWLDDPEVSFGERLERAGRELKALLAETSERAESSPADATLSTGMR